MLLAAELHLDFIAQPDSEAATVYDYLLLMTPQYLCLHDCKHKKIRDFYIDFLAGKLHHRRQHTSIRKELLAKAMGRKPSTQLHLVDATAGLGRDSFILATLGFRITLLERSPIVFALLQDAMQRASQHGQLATILERMRLIQVDATHWLKTMLPQQRPPIIYLDPMFPERKKSAAVKKDMAILQELLGNETDTLTLFEAALTCATERVVVKRPRLAMPLGNLAPHFSMHGKHSRFDIYLTKQSFVNKETT